MTKKADTWMPLYVTDYLGDTMHLTTEQHGAYMLLLMACWKSNGALPMDDEALASIAKLPVDRWQTHGKTLRRFFEVVDGLLIHGRVEKERAKALGISAERSKAGKHGALKRWQEHDKPMANAQQSDAPSPSHSSSTKKKRAQAPALTGLESVPEALMDDFKTLRRAKRLPLTQTAVDGLVREAAKAGMSVADAIKTSVENSWAGFRADWVKTEKQKKADLATMTVPSDPRAEEAAARRREAEAMTPEQKEAADKARRIAMAAIKNITPRQAA